MTQVRKTSLSPSRRPSMIGRWLAVAAVAISIAVPAGAAGYYDPAGGGTVVSPGPSQGAGPELGHFRSAERTASELAQRVPASGVAQRLAQRVESPSAASTDDGFSWADAGIGAATVAGLAALAGAAYSVRRRTHAAPGPAV